MRKTLMMEDAADAKIGASLQTNAVHVHNCCSRHAHAPAYQQQLSGMKFSKLCSESLYAQYCHRADFSEFSADLTIVVLNIELLPRSVMVLSKDKTGRTKSFSSSFNSVVGLSASKTEGGSGKGSWRRNKSFSSSSTSAVGCKRTTSAVGCKRAEVGKRKIHQQESSQSSSEEDEDSQGESDCSEGKDTNQDLIVYDTAYVHGRYARLVRDMLEIMKVDCEEVSSTEELDARAWVQLIWESSMWLLSATNDDCCIRDIITLHRPRLRALVGELSSIARRTHIEDSRSHERTCPNRGAWKELLEVDAVMADMDRRSRQVLSRLSLSSYGTLPYCRRRKEGLLTSVCSCMVFCRVHLCVNLCTGNTVSCAQTRTSKATEDG